MLAGTDRLSRQPKVPPMLGPVDLEDWYDEDDHLRARLSLRPEMQYIRSSRSVGLLPGWNGEDFSLARRFAAGEPLSSNEMRRLEALFRA
jgi:hypothetical protein